MELEDYYENAKRRNVKDTTGPQRHSQNEGRSRNHRIRCLVLIIVCLGILCLLLIAGMILQFFWATSKQAYQWGPDGLFISNDWKTWSESRQYCRDRGADLAIINTEEKQRHITSLVREKVWIGLSDFETEGIMKWVDNSPLKYGFWLKGQPDSYAGDEDCIILDPVGDSVHNWHDYPCSEKIKCICEK